MDECTSAQFAVRHRRIAAGIIVGSAECTARLDGERFDEMTRKRGPQQGQRELELLGIDENEEQLYRWLLAHPGATVSRIADALELGPRKTQRLLESLESKGLTNHSPEKPRRYIPAPPNLAIEALILDRQDRLRRLRATVSDLDRQAQKAQGNGGESVVEIASSAEARRLIVEQIDRAATDEIVTLIRKPILVTSLDQPDSDPTQRAAQARGVRMRSIADADYLTLPGAVRRTFADLRAGEDIRVLPELPFKMVLADRRIAIIPLDLKQAGGPSLLVRSSALLDALYALFEILWERAAPIALSPEGELALEAAGDAHASGDRLRLVSLLAAGMNDKGIAHELGMSERTLGRRVVELMQALDARTRFQAGWQAAMREALRDIGGSRH